MLLYAGDFVSPFTDREIKNIQCPFTGEFGNNNGDRLFLLNYFQKIEPIYPEPYKTDIDGKKIIMFHKNDIIADLGKSQIYDVIIYSHAHQIDHYTEGRTTALNPRECGGWLTGISTITILDLLDLQVRIICL